MRSTVVTFIVLVVLVGCDRSPPPLERQSEPIQTDSLEYTLHYTPGLYDAAATATYMNLLETPVFYNLCNFIDPTPFYTLHRAPPNEGMSSALQDGGACVGNVPRGEVSPGETLSFKVWLGSFETPGTNPPIRAEERIGRFRITLQLFSEAGTNDETSGMLPVEERQSNVFEIQFGD